MKLSALTIILIGVSIAIIAFSYGFFQHYMPNSKETEYYHTYRDQLQHEADQLTRAKQRVETAKKMVEDKASDWRAIVAIHTPPPSVAQGGINIGVQGWQLTVDSLKFRNNIQRALNAQLHKGGVKVLNGPPIPPPPDSAASILANYYNYPVIPFPVVVFDLGTVTVRGTYKQITDHIRSWSSMPRYLAVVDGLRLDGTAPTLTATYNLSLVGYIRGTQIFPAVPEGAASASNGGGGGGGGGGGQMGTAPASIGGPGGRG